MDSIPETIQKDIKAWEYLQSLSASDMKNCAQAKNYPDCKDCPISMFDARKVCMNFKTASN